MELSVINGILSVLGMIAVAIMGYMKVKKMVEGKASVSAVTEVNKAQTDLREYLTAQLKETDSKLDACEKERAADRKRHNDERMEDELRFRKLVKEQTDQLIVINKMRTALESHKIKVIM